MVAPTQLSGDLGTTQRGNTFIAKRELHCVRKHIHVGVGLTVDRHPRPPWSSRIPWFSNTPVKRSSWSLAVASLFELSTGVV